MKTHLDNSQVSEIQIWSIFARKVRTFEKTSDLNVFKLVFKKEGQRLFNHFILDCESTLSPFYSYLTIEERNELLIYIVKLHPQNNLF